MRKSDQKFDDTATGAKAFLKSVSNLSPAAIDAAKATGDPEFSGVWKLESDGAEHGDGEPFLAVIVYLDDEDFEVEQ